MLMRMVTSFASSLSRGSNVLATPPAYLCRMQPAPRIRYRTDHLSQVPPQQLVTSSALTHLPVLIDTYSQALQNAIQVFHGR